VEGETTSGKEQPAPEWHYANCIQVGHNAFEFLLDFGQMSETRESTKNTVRIVGNPQFANALYDTLGEAIREYERAFGTIRGSEEA